MLTGSLTRELRTLLIPESERVRIDLDADGAAVSWWDRDEDVLRTLVNVGALAAGDQRFPADEAYPLDSFPAMAALLRAGESYLNPKDVSSLAVAASDHYDSQAGAPLIVDGEVWGELWIGRAVGRPALTGLDAHRLELAAVRLADGLAALAER
jgi:GAF domain-containing protein